MRTIRSIDRLEALQNTVKQYCNTRRNFQAILNSTARIVDELQSVKHSVSVVNKEYVIKCTN